MAIDTLLEHNKVCKRISDFFEARSATTQLEIPLSKGRGAVDVVVSKKGLKTKYIEVKSHPASLNQRGIQKQLERYEQEFPDQDYFLAFPLRDYKIALCNYKTNQRVIIGT